MGGCSPNTNRLLTGQRRNFRGIPHNVMRSLLARGWDRVHMPWKNLPGRMWGSGIPRHMHLVPHVDATSYPITRCTTPVVGVCTVAVVMLMHHEQWWGVGVPWAQLPCENSFWQLFSKADFLPFITAVDIKAIGENEWQRAKLIPLKIVSWVFCTEWGSSGLLSCYVPQITI